MSCVECGKDPSYYPITAHLAQTGHLLRVQNRSGNVHDGKAGLPFLRDLFVQLQESFGTTSIEIRLDGAFFRREIVTCGTSGPLTRAHA